MRQQWKGSAQYRKEICSKRIENTNKIELGEKVSLAPPTTKNFQRVIGILSRPQMRHQFQAVSSRKPSLDPPSNWNYRFCLEGARLYWANKKMRSSRDREQAHSYARILPNPLFIICEPSRQKFVVVLHSLKWELCLEIVLFHYANVPVID